MWLCDNDPPESSDQVLFFCEEQMNIECDDNNSTKCNTINDKNSSKFHQQHLNKAENCNDEPKKKAAHIFNWKKNKKNLSTTAATTVNDNNSSGSVTTSNSAMSNRCDVAIGSDDTDNYNSTNCSTSKKSIGLGTDDDLNQTGHTILVKIQVENCSSCPMDTNTSSISFFSHDTPINKNKEHCITNTTSCNTNNIKNSNNNSSNSSCSSKIKKKTVAVQVNINSVESVVESHCLKISKLRCCNKVTRTSSVNNNNNNNNMNKGKKCNVERDDNKTINDDDNTTSNVTPNTTTTTMESAKIYLLNGKNINQYNVDKQQDNVDNTSDKPLKLHGKSLSVDRTSIKSRKFSNAVSPLKKFNRSSLTIEPDKITINQTLHCYNNINHNNNSATYNSNNNGRGSVASVAAAVAPFANNLSKYSPCASRLAASSKILGNISPTSVSPDSPLHVARPKSPRTKDCIAENFQPPPPISPSLLSPPPVTFGFEKSHLQTSLSLNINSLKKSHSTTSRSRSVGDSCVTSPTSEATTLSYSPTGTEILSLDDVGQQAIPVSNSVSLSAPDLTALHNEKLTISFNFHKANLETKC